MCINITNNRRFISKSYIWREENKMPEPRFPFVGLYLEIFTQVLNSMERDTQMFIVVSWPLLYPQL